MIILYCMLMVFCTLTIHLISFLSRKEDYKRVDGKSHKLSLIKLYSLLKRQLDIWILTHCLYLLDFPHAWKIL